MPINSTGCTENPGFYRPSRPIYRGATGTGDKAVLFCGSPASGLGCIRTLRERLWILLAARGQLRRGLCLRHGLARQGHGHPTVLGPVGLAAVTHQRVALAMEAHNDMLGRNTAGPKAFLHRHGTAPRGVAVGQTIAGIVGMAVELDAIDARI